MTVMATANPATLTKIANGEYEVLHATTGKHLGRVHRTGNSWKARATVYEWNQPVRTIYCGSFPTRREAVAEVWIQRDKLATD